MHRDTPHQKHKQQHAQQMPPKRHQHPPAARQRPSLDQELYAAPHTTTGIGAVQHPATNMPLPRQPNPQRPNLGRPFYAASRKARTTNPARIYAADCRAKPALPARRSNPQRPNLKRSFYAASCKPRTTNLLWIYAAPRTALTPHAVTVAAKMAVAGTAKTKAATAATERHMHMPPSQSNPQRPNLGHEFYAASRKARATNTPRIYAAPRTAPTPRATTVAAKMAAAETAKTKAATAPTGRHMHMPPSRPNPRPNLGRRFYAASCKPRTTNPPRIYAAPRIARPIGAVQHPGAGMPPPPQPNPERPNLGRQLYAAACMAGATTSARRPSPQTPNLRRHPYAASCKVDTIAPLYAAPCNRVPASRTYQG